METCTGLNYTFVKEEPAEPSTGLTSLDFGQGIDQNGRGPHELCPQFGGALSTTAAVQEIDLKFLKSEEILDVKNHQQNVGQLADGNHTRPIITDPATLTPLGYVMSTSQLDELWKLDMEMAHLIMEMPLRTCSAKPKPLPIEFPDMDSLEFRRLKAQIRRMWLIASLHFEVKETEHGWGLFIHSDPEPNSKLPFSQTVPAILGWLARAPSESDCPTGHRYLRSPCSTNIYLGGPISLANYDSVDRVKCIRSSSLDSRHKHKMLVYKVSGKLLQPGMEILWTYNFDVSIKKCPQLHLPEEWQLVDVCCSTSDKQQQCSSPVADLDSVVKKRKVSDAASARPHKTSKIVKSFTMCTYCGKNLSEPLKRGEKVNLKRHLALKHSAALCCEMGVENYDAEEGVSGEAFMKHLDCVDHVYRSLMSHQYKIVPACNFLNINDSSSAEYSQNEQDELFKSFVAEGVSSFKKYQVLYLKGITVPTSFSDLLKEDDTSYDKINWVNERPSSNNFSLNAYKLSQEEIDKHAEEIKVKLSCAVMDWSVRV